MQTSPATPEQVRQWKRIFAEKKDSLTPNRKTGAEVEAYFCAHYPHTAEERAALRAALSGNISRNGHSAQKLPAGMQPDIAVYRTGDVMVAIDRVTGEFQVESENIGHCIPIHEDLFRYRGLDREDLQNFYLVAEYVRLIGLL